MNFKKNKLWENIWFIICVLAASVLSIIFSNNALMIISTITGVIYSVAIGYEDRFAYIFGFISFILYGFIMLFSSIYAIAVFNLIYAAPMTIFCFISWNRMAKNKNDNIRSLTSGKLILVLDSIIILSAAIFFILNSIGGQFVLLDAFITGINIVGYFLMLKKYLEQWWLWLFSNLLGLTIWIVKTIYDFNNFPFLFLSIIYTINGIYALIRWYIKFNKQKLVVKAA